MADSWRARIAAIRAALFVPTLTRIGKARDAITSLYTDMAAAEAADRRWCREVERLTSGVAQRVVLHVLTIHARDEYGGCAGCHHAVAWRDCESVTALAQDLDFPLPTDGGNP